MRKLIIFVALFMLLAVPALADNPEDVVVTVTIPLIDEFFIDVTNMETTIAPEWDDGYADESLGWIEYDVTTNMNWDLMGSWADTGLESTVPDGWGVEEAYDNATWLSLAETTPASIADETSVGSFDFIDEDHYFQLVGLALADPPDDYEITLTLTLKN